jgi:hypothetical protein
LCKIYLATSDEDAPVTPPAPGPAGRRARTACAPAGPPGRSLTTRAGELLGQFVDSLDEILERAELKLGVAA